MSNRPVSLLAPIGLGIALLIGCSGGGGGGGSAPAALVYTGPTTPAALTTDLAVADLTGSAVSGAGPVAIAFGVATSPRPQAGAGLLHLTQALSRLATQARPAAGLAAGVAAPVPGVCGGTVTTSVSGPSNGRFTASGTMVFNQFCNPALDGSNIILDGTVNVSMDGPDNADYTFHLDSALLTVADAYSSSSVDIYQYDLDFDCVFSANHPGPVTLNATVRQPGGKIFKMVDYTVESDGLGWAMAVNGTFYHPDHGWVTVSTPAGLTYSSCSSLGGLYVPIRGSIRVTSANGDFGEFLPVDCYQFQIGRNNGTQVTTTYSWQ